jgi:hypothetical protein
MVTLNRLIKSTFLFIRLLIFFFAKMSDTDGKVKDVSQKNVIYDFFAKRKKKNDFLSNNHKRRQLRQV